jgi:hypothetical protein
LSGSETTIDVPAVRRALAAQGTDLSTMSDDQVRGMVEAHANAFRDNAPTTAAQAATTILNGVREGKWRILVGQDAEFMDSMVRERPEEAYTADFYQAIVKGTKWKI